MLAKRQHRFEPDYAVSPGLTLREVMESREMTQKELAKRTELTAQTLNRIFKGEQPITYETAGRLELVTGVPASFWNNLEAQYREQLAKIEERKRFEKVTEWLKSIPVKDLQERGLLTDVDDKTELLRETLGFYGVSSVDAWEKVWETPAVAARRSPCFETLPGPASAWIRQGELIAQEIECAPFDRALFQESLKEIRGLTVEVPEVFEPRMRELCAKAGVALALVPKMSKVPWNGATKWLSPTKAMILLNLRGKGEDRFWFSFFHEAGHVLQGHKRALLINDGTEDDERERNANEFAAEFLIPEQWNDRIRAIESGADVTAIAAELGVCPGIVAGRYHYLTEKWSFYKRMIRILEWVEK